jgi:predicted  nucleic acid-binding Zn-ribbon protein
MHPNGVSPGVEQSVTVPPWLKYLIGASCLFLAGCSAFFSVCGLGMLFVGSATAVMIMASSLEVGKLVAASFLYWFWRQLRFPMRFYMTAAVVVLIGITSLGTYGYLARAYERTHTGIGIVEAQVAGLQKEIADTQRQIDDARNRFGKVDHAGHEDAAAVRQRMTQATTALDQALARLQEQRKPVQDRRDHDMQLLTARLAEQDELLKKSLASEDATIADLQQQLAALDRAVDAYTKIGGPGLLPIGGPGIFRVDGVKRGQDLREQQQPQRDTIAKAIVASHDRQEQFRVEHAKRVEAADLEIDSIRKQAVADTDKLDAAERDQRKACADTLAQAQAQLAAMQTSSTALQSTDDTQVEALQQHIRACTEDIRVLQEKIATTDIGSYRFVARAFDTGADNVVKWLMLVLVIVFDPLAVCLAVGFNVAILRERREKMVAAFARTGAPHAVPVDGEGAILADAPAPPARRRNRWLSFGVNLLLILLLVGIVAFGVYWLIQAGQQRARTAHAQWIPADSFAVAVVRPGEIARQDAARNVAGWVGKSDTSVLAPLLACVNGGGFDPNADVYLFAKFPDGHAAGKSSRPVILCGLVAQVTQPAVAETTLSGVAERINRSLRPAHDPAVALTRNRTMIQAGQGRYMDPEGGFFTFALTARAAILLIEFEGDPQAPAIETEIRHCLAPDPHATAPAPHADGVVSVWFDANRFFRDVPKNPAAETRYRQLQRFLDFDLVLSVRPIGLDKLNIAARYDYQVDRFNQPRQPTAAELLATLGADDAAGIAGRLMDRCADTLDYDSLAERLRADLGGNAKDGIQAVVVEKSCDSPRDARFVLTACCDAKTKTPLLAAFQTLWQ